MEQSAAGLARACRTRARARMSGFGRVRRHVGLPGVIVVTQRHCGAIGSPAARRDLDAVSPTKRGQLEASPVRRRRCRDPRQCDAPRPRRRARRGRHFSDRSCRHRRRRRPRGADGSDTVTRRPLPGDEPGREALDRYEQRAVGRARHQHTGLQRQRDGPAGRHARPELREHGLGLRVLHRRVRTTAAH